MIPANLATSSGFPLGFSGSARRTSGRIATKALASASRLVACLAETSTIVARPLRSEWESSRGIGTLLSILQKRPALRKNHDAHGPARLLGLDGYPLLSRIKPVAAVVLGDFQRDWPL